MLLSQLIESAGLASQIEILSQEDPEIQKISDDSRLADASTLFVATEIGKPYLDQALASGVRAILMEEQGAQAATSVELLQKINQNGVLILRVGHLLQTQGRLAAALYGDPSRKLRIIGVTGTNGKTSTAWILFNIWKALSIPCGMIGTLGVYYRDDQGKDHSKTTGYTTPRAPALQEIFHEMIEGGVRRLAMEVSSEALELGRLCGTHFHAAIFTNLTPDHLDFHKTMDHYFRAKLKLLHSTLEEGGEIYLFQNAPYAMEYQLELEAALSGTMENTTDPSSIKQRNRIHTITDPYSGPFSLPGRFNAINGALAIAAAADDFSTPDPLERIMAQIPQIPGRMNLILPPGVEAKALPDRCAIVDYAHTPDALEKVLTELRYMGVVRVMTVFGCGGDRDRAKRPLMGKIAALHSDLVIVTDDNPRSEDPGVIRQSIMYGVAEAPDGSKKCQEIADRRQAIRAGVEWLNGCRTLPALLLVAGKGHETVQIYGNRKDHFSDTEELTRAFQDVGPGDF